ncbi:thiamine pyrophosphate-binding protein [Corynebacterium pseudodiphtheriticum]|uniref:thiamine pyrophosphate-dependent enzyme n=1 Tax=Corynebacterium pseudodiphtheriticum TaxID=37637 RepID=UPI00254F018D|nr:thiamine pyrophosphate-dependent enzyme [Corynebacterium pseudodiphtheriticum]MDK8613298.1 thiamine pyrophosphate-binding protein [Corynebacterium pseudodiphtheriticum]MDK8737230.1 thiamine pyrophosphate-binding protein [Corynebacterium pseudodiphtheriticum]MDK8744625.1 thiamine pyrophosphate-binding protein [Corynebacterium pseudodiphtheriticum]
MSVGHVGTAIARSLELHDVPRIFQVPGESFLPVLDGLYESSIDTVVCRQEGGACYMAEAHGKATGQPGVAMVTRGPGAANAFVGIHTAWQDATPLVLFVGLVPTSDRDRESFQEFDIKAWFGTQAKRVYVLDDASRASRVVAEAFHLATQGRPGPVIIGLPEDVLHQEFTGDLCNPLPASHGAFSDADLDYLASELRTAEKPLIFAGGAHWTPETSAAVQKFAEQQQIPVVHDWRASDRTAFSSPANAGWLGYGRNDAAAELLCEADLVVELGAVLTDVPTDGYTLRQNLDAKNIVINTDTTLLGNSAAVSHHILASPQAFAQVTEELAKRIGSEERVSAGSEANTGTSASTDAAISATQHEWFTAAHREHLAFSHVGKPEDWPATAQGTAHMAAIMAAIQEQAPHDALYTFGAGNHCLWAQRYLRTETYPSQLSVRNGSMGYSIPSAVAASLQFPERTVITIAGDGEYLMNGQELATAVQAGGAFLVVVMSNAEFGTIRTHQLNHYPRRVSGTQLANPDFAAAAVAFGAHGETITSDQDATSAVKRALAAVREGKPALINVITDQALSIPTIRQNTEE